jgi:hypothetical protein
MNGFRPGHEPKQLPAIKKYLELIGVSTDHPPGVIGMVSSERTGFYYNSCCLAWLKKPAGSGFFMFEAGTSLAWGRNQVVEEALRADAAWLWFMDDDHVFAPETLMRLLDRRVSIVQPLYVGRRSPHEPILFDYFPVEASMSDEQLVHSARHARIGGPYSLAPFQTGLVEVGLCGTGGLLIDMKVFKALDPPWFVNHSQGHAIAEDTWFTLRARRAGFKCFVDFDTPIGHLTIAALWPRKVDALGLVKVDVEWGNSVGALRQRLREPT